ncbi:hypothetical protein D3C80_1939990 [compost metagenome]
MAVSKPSARRKVRQRYSFSTLLEKSMVLPGTLPICGLKMWVVGVVPFGFSHWPS